MMNKTMCLMLTAVLAVPVAGSAQSLEGKWEGNLSAAGMTLDITVIFEGEGDALKATIDIPAQGAVRVPLVIQTHEHPNITFVINGVPGEPTFAGTHDADSITGAFTQGGAAGGFRLIKAEAESEGGWTVRRLDGRCCGGSVSGPPWRYVQNTLALHVEV